MPDFMPTGDAELVAWTTTFMTYANGNLTALGLAATDMMGVSATQSGFSNAFNTSNAAQNAAKNAVAAKDAARALLEAQVRIVVRKLQGTASVTNAQRESLGITLRGQERSPIDAPTTRPVLQVDTSQRFRHSVAFADQNTLRSKAKPDGVSGCQIWVKIGGVPPVNVSEMTFLALDTRTPYTAEYDGDDAGKTAHYWGRWANTKGEPGPWSETASATVGG